MARPTEKLAARSEVILGEPVDMAVRVKFGESGPTPMNPSVTWAFEFIFLFIPFLIRGIYSRIRAAFSETDRGGVVAFTSDGGIALLGLPWWSKMRPKIFFRKFPAGVPMVIDPKRLGKHLVLECTVDGLTFRVNTLDGKAIFRQAKAGEFSHPAILNALPRYEEYMDSPWVNLGDPNRIHKG